MNSFFPKSKLIYKTFGKAYGGSPNLYKNNLILPDKISSYLKTQNFDLNNLYFCNQVHKNNIVFVNPSRHFYKTTDGLITNQKNLILTIRHSDCLPVFVYDSAQNIIALVHSGWKGANMQIVSKTIKRLIRYYYSKPQDLQVKVGPHAQECCYFFKKDWPHLILLQKPDWQPFIHKNRNKYYLDISGYIKQNLINLGLKKESIRITQSCTICNHHYYSWSRQRFDQIKSTNNLSIFALI
jgi:purine-nucleoside/S-methyl-5'-thioadenosine phosphorylase / adenosine deaminase